jgi:hypothetical protein
MLAKLLGIENKNETVSQKSQDTLQINGKSYAIYNSINIMDVDSSESGSPYIRHFYACPDFDYKGWVYDDTYLHILRKHFKIFIEPEFLKNKDYVQALKERDRKSILKRSCPTISNWNMESARRTFLIYNSMNQRYFKKSLPEEGPMVIEKCDVPMFKKFIERICGTDDLKT